MLQMICESQRMNSASGNRLFDTRSSAIGAHNATLESWTPVLAWGLGFALLVSAVGIEVHMLVLPSRLGVTLGFRLEP